jgi:hypothetical protein
MLLLRGGRHRGSQGRCDGCSERQAKLLLHHQSSLRAAALRGRLFCCSRP